MQKKGQAKASGKTVSNANTTESKDSAGLSLAPPVFQLMTNSSENPPTDNNSKAAGNNSSAAVMQKMENSFGTDFSNVKYTKIRKRQLILGALAYAQGSDIHFAPGQYNPSTQGGQELLGHELTHVVQQREGRVKPTVQAKGVAINNDAGLEKEADVLGAKAARGEKVGSAGGANNKGNTTQLKVIQRRVNVQRFREVMATILRSVGGGIPAAGDAAFPSSYDQEFTPAYMNVLCNVFKAMHPNYQGANGRSAAEWATSALASLRTLSEDILSSQLQQSEGAILPV